MAVISNILLWLHFVGVAMALGGGIALGVTGPQFIAEVNDHPDLVWATEKALSRVGTIGLVVLLVTGPLMIWLKFDGTAGFNWWFWLKMVFVAAAVIGVGLHQWGGRRFRGGDKSALRTMLVSGRAAGISMVLVVLCAVFAFN